MNYLSREAVKRINRDHVSDLDGQCGECSDDWPCDMALLVREVIKRRLLANG